MLEHKDKEGKRYPNMMNAKSEIRERKGMPNLGSRSPRLNEAKSLRFKYAYQAAGPKHLCVWLGQAYDLGMPNHLC